jgi:hypothetical protein
MTVANPIEPRKPEIREKLSALFQVCSKWQTSIEFNWTWGIFFAFFLAYGYYGALTPPYAAFKTNLTASLGQLMLLGAILFIFGYVAWKKPGSFKDSISISAQDVLVCISLALVCLVLSHERLQYSLFSDEISYSGSAHGHSIYFALALAKHLPELGAVTAQYLVQAISLTLLASLVALIWFSACWTPKARIAAFLLLLLAARMVFAIKGGNGSPHPPLHLLPLFISGSLMGINDLSFKLSYFLAYAVFLTLLYRMLLRVFPGVISYVTVLAIGTMPLLSYLSTVVEHSFWAFICFSLVFVEIITSSRLNYPRLISLVSIAVLMRQPSFLALFPIILLYVLGTFNLKSAGQWVKESVFIFLPLLLFLPMLLSSLLHGTPATDALGHGSMIERVKTAVESGMVWDSISSAIPVWWLLIIPFAFLPLSAKIKNLNAGLFLFAVIAVGVYYAINPSLWGYAKYQAEYAAPVALAGLLLFMNWVKERDSRRHFLLACILPLLILNIRDLAEAPHLKQIAGHDLEAEFDVVLASPALKPLLAAVPYEYKKAYAFIRGEGLDGAAYSIGATYGVLPEIMNGYSASAVLASHEIYTGQEANRFAAMQSGLSVDMVESDTRIKAVMVGAIPGKQKIIERFRQKGWEETAEFKNKRYGTTVVIMKRPVAWRISNSMVSTFCVDCLGRH